MNTSTSSQPAPTNHLAQDPASRNLQFEHFGHLNPSVVDPYPSSGGDPYPAKSSQHPQQQQQQQQPPLYSQHQLQQPQHQQQPLSSYPQHAHDPVSVVNLAPTSLHQQQQQQQQQPPQSAPNIVASSAAVAHASHPLPSAAQQQQQQQQSPADYAAQQLAHLSLNESSSSAASQQQQQQQVPSQLHHPQQQQQQLQAATSAAVSSYPSSSHMSAMPSSMQNQSSSVNQHPQAMASSNAPQHFSPSPIASSGIASNPDELLCRILADAKLCGGLIGRGGKRITEIRSSSGAYIEVKKPVPYASKRIVQVKGEIDKVISGVEKIIERLAAVMMEGRDGTGGDGRMAPELDFTLLLPSPQIGAVIGKGGNHISETRSSSGASVKVDADVLRNCTEKTVTISGSPDSVKNAASRILHQVHTCPERGVAKIMYEPHAEGAAVANAAAVAMSGFGAAAGAGAAAAAFNGAAAFTGHRNSGAGQPPNAYATPNPANGNQSYNGGGYHPQNPQMYPYNQSAATAGATGTAGAGQFTQAPGPYGAAAAAAGYQSQFGGNPYGNTQQFPHQAGGYQQQAGAPGGYQQAGAGAGGYQQPPYYGTHDARSASGVPPPPAIPPAQGNESVMVPYPVDKKKVGAVIGRGGNNISAIRQQSGAQIRIEEPLEGSAQRMITITGTQKSVATAVSLIHQHLST